MKLRRSMMKLPQPIKGCLVVYLIELTAAFVCRPRCGQQPDKLVRPGNHFNGRAALEPARSPALPALLWLR